FFQARAEEVVEGEPGTEARQDREEHRGSPAHRGRRDPDASGRPRSRRRRAAPGAGHHRYPGQAQAHREDREEARRHAIDEQGEKEIPPVGSRDSLSGTEPRSWPPVAAAGESREAGEELFRRSVGPAGSTAIPQ